MNSADLQSSGVTPSKATAELVSLFRHFCMHPLEAKRGHVLDIWKTPRVVWTLAGSDGTQTWENRMRTQIGEEAYENLHWVLVALDGKIIVASMRNKAPGVEQAPVGSGLPAAIFRRLLDIDEHANSAAAYENVVPVPPAGVRAFAKVLGRRIADEYLAKIHLLPNPYFCGPESENADPVYFRFDGGVGAVMPLC